MTVGLIVLLAVLVAVLTLLSYADRVYDEAGKFLSREFQENIDVFEEKIEPRLGAGRERAQLSIAVLTPLIMAGIGLVIGYSVFRDASWTLAELTQAVVSIVL